jgi:hypothetical protein
VTDLQILLIAIVAIATFGGLLVLCDRLSR